MFGTLNDSTILRLRVKGSDLDPLALRGRLENLLSEVSMQPRLPPSATLFIRKLSDPLPGAVQLDSSHAHAPQAWRHAFQTKFDQLVSSAARPAHGLVADSAESVVFYDYAELLASLTADWCSGFAATRWWWQALIKRGDVAQVIRQFWREKIEYVPAALEHVSRKGVLVEFVTRLTDSETRELVEKVVKVFGLHAISITEIIEPRIRRIENADFSAEAEAPFSQVAPVTHERSKEMPWRYVVPESDTPRFTPAQQLFVGIALMVHRAPARVRTLSFAREVERWCVIEVPPNVIEPVIHEETIETATAPAKPAETPALIGVDQIDAPPELVTSDPPEVQKSASSAVEKPVKVGNAVFTYEQPTKVNEESPVVESEQAPVETFVSPSSTLDAITIETDLGGLFYLINLAIFLEIYSDFTSPVEQFHDDLSIWDFVMIVGDHINQHCDLDDPIWTGLQDLQDLHDTDHEPTWLVDMLPHLRARLILALGIDEDTNLAKLLLHHHARVTITPTHLDVFFSLSDHPIEIRLAGLDRDPGWVPAAGRFIAFHYD